MKYIQSFYQYPVSFNSIGKSIPSRDASGELRNIAAFEDKEIETLERSEPFFRSLVNLKKIRVLNHLPESYKPAAAQVNEALEAADAAKAEAEELRAKLAKYEGTSAAAPAEDKEDDGEDFSKLSYKELQAKAKELGVENTNVSKAKLLEAVKAAK